MILGVLGLTVFLGEHIGAQQGPNSDSSTTVARPRKPGANGSAPAPEPDQAKIPSKFGKPETAADKVIVLLVFALGLAAGLVNWYLMDPGFFRR